MPWVSKAQRAWAHSTGQPWASKWDAHTPNGAKLPMHAAYGGDVPSVMTNEHLPQGDETQVCPSCGYAFGGEMRGMAPDQEESSPMDDAIRTFAEALQRSGRY